jgi:simple sugar transport system permease protein
MNEETLSILNGIVASATPLVIASIGETITERAGVVNLSLDGSIVLCAMAGFAGAYLSNSVIVGLLVAMLVGALVALIIAVADIELRQDQIAIGFVLTILATDLATFLGSDFVRKPGPTIPYWPMPFLSDIPVVGRIFFDHNILVYFSYVLIFASWYWLFRTKAGLAHRAVGERPEAAFARGVKVNTLRYIYTAVGGALVGLAGATFSLSVKVGWATGQFNGNGWIALAIVIFGGWHPFRVVLGAYLFAALRALTGAVQRDPNSSFSPVLLNMIPWILMIVTLVLVSSGAIERLLLAMPRPVQKWTRNFLRSDPPAALGTRFEGR